MQHLGMIKIREIAAKIEAQLYEFSKHALDQSIVRSISVSEIEEAVTAKALIIEDYPNDKYGPSCLILGYTKKGRPLHVQCSYQAQPLIKIVTLYQPDTELWIEDRDRKTKRKV